MWSVSDAKAHLSQVLRLARAGEPQTIGSQSPCVLLPLAEYEKLLQGDGRGHDGDWLIRAASKIGADIQLPSRVHDRDDLPFGD